MKLYLFEDKNIAEERIDIHYRAMTIHLNRIIGAIKEGEPSVTGWDENNESKVFNYFGDVYYFESVDRKSYAYLKEKTYKVDMTLGKVLDDYGDFGFVRINKSQVVNIYKIKSIKHTAGMRVVALLNNGENLIINRSYREAFEHALMEIKKKKS